MFSRDYNFPIDVLDHTNKLTLPPQIFCLLLLVILTLDEDTRAFVLQDALFGFDLGNHLKYRLHLNEAI